LLLQQPAQVPTTPARRWRLPVCYGEGFGADLADVAAAAGMSAEAVVQLHSSTEFKVYMLGFMPGFAFMGDLPSALAVPRRREPRLRVPAGSVAITGSLTAIYPWESPGGWQLLGRCPVPLFDPGAAMPALLAQGDSVCFEPVSADHFAELAVQARAGGLARESLMEAA
jgi:inhibitor of KinA